MKIIWNIRFHFVSTKRKTVRCKQMLVITKQRVRIWRAPSYCEQMLFQKKFFWIKSMCEQFRSKTYFLWLTHFYCLPVKLWEGNVFTHVCLSFCPWGGACHVAITYNALDLTILEPPGLSVPLCKPLGTGPLLLTSGGQDWRSVQTCSNEGCLLVYALNYSLSAATL